MSEVMSIAMVLRPPNVTPKTSTGLPLPNTHQCIDLGDGNYTCTGSMNDEYLQFYLHDTSVHRYSPWEPHMLRFDEC